MDYENEEWRDVVGYEGYYQVSDMGRVRSVDRIDSISRHVSERMMTLSPDRGGYMKVKLYKEGKDKKVFVHRLVLAAFIGEIPFGYECNHISGMKSNNCLGNLEYCTRSENTLHAYRKLGKKSNLQGERNWASRLLQGDVIEIRQLFSTGQFSINDLAVRYKVGWSTIADVVNRRTWQHI